MKNLFEQISAEIEREMKKAEKKIAFADKASEIAKNAINDTVVAAKECDQMPTAALKALAYTILDAIIQTDMDKYDPETGKMVWRGKNET